ncbi:MAG: GH3 auxin-responsive promoter family protein [Oscillatoria sp. PMC 1068.18]|nr:GH3 auxin-responsive promoter family protein [Oscillatoria sp. PMC 1076.18]MEC4987365.1 GH3 auxin-responsive promoter family protein [Oscillatoria sp. PMC 1068.18]
MTNLFFSLLTSFSERAKDNFLKKLNQTPTIQEKFLLQLLQAHKNTELGQKYQLQDIKTIDQFREQIPVLPYANYEPYINRIAQGAKNVLTPDPVVYLNMTSGSTGNPKLIPVTKRFQNTLGKANFISIGFLSQALRSHGSQFGKLLATNSPKLYGTTDAGIPYGPASTGVLRMGKWVYGQLFAMPYETLKVDELVARHYVALLFALQDTNLRGIGQNFPMLLLRLANYLETYSEELIHNLETGTIANWLQIEPELRTKLENIFHATPQRAQELKEILHSEGKLTPKLAWKNLSFLVSARGGTSDFYFQRFPEYFGDTPGFGAVYSSSEGTFSINHSLNVDSSILAIESGFFEFVPQDQWSAEHPKTLLATEVKPGRLYRILTTNYSGFYRYDIGDVVEVVGFHEQTPLLVFRFRQGGIISATTEKTTEFQVTKVMEALQQEFNVALEDFCITLSAGEFPARYLVNIELAKGQNLPDLPGFLASFDNKLKEANSYYELKRRDQIQPPRLRLLQPGSFGIIRQRQLDKGMPDFQLKFPHTSEDRNFLAGLEIEKEVSSEELSLT